MPLFSDGTGVIDEAEMTGIARERGSITTIESLSDANMLHSCTPP